MNNDYRDKIKNLKGTLGVEGINISKSSMHNLNRMMSGTATCSQLVDEIKLKYMQRI